jgi:septal ring factor EnvC (AmiA/AmiB activator)
MRAVPGNAGHCALKGKQLMAKIDERIATLQTRLQQLKAQQQRIAARQKSIESQRQRKADTRRKILVGAIVLARIEQGRLSEAELRGWMDEGLTRPEDRALFDLAARASN